MPLWVLKSTRPGPLAISPCTTPHPHCLRYEAALAQVWLCSNGVSSQHNVMPGAVHTSITQSGIRLRTRWRRGPWGRLPRVKLQDQTTSRAAIPGCEKRLLRATSFCRSEYEYRPVGDRAENQREPPSASMIRGLVAGAEERLC